MDVVVVVVVVASFDPLHANFQTNKSLTCDSLVELAKKIQFEGLIFFMMFALGDNRLRNHFCGVNLDQILRSMK